VKGPKVLLPEGTWTPEPSSLVDSVGRVIHYDGRVLRGIRKEFATEVTTILDIAERHHWFDHGLVPTWATDFETEEFPLVLEHRRIPFVTMRGEWSAEAVRRAALCHLELSAVLARSGYGLKDAHTWNLLFAGSTPMVTDFGSIRPFADVYWPGWFTQFHKYFLVPLLIFAKGRTGLARALLQEHLAGAGIWLIDHAPGSLLPGEPTVTSQAADNPQEEFARLHDLVSGLTFPHAPTEWTGYPQPGTGPDELRQKDRLVMSLLERLRFRTAIDLGANRGLHASMCAAAGASVLACDIDETCLDHMFLHPPAGGGEVLPLYLNMVLPAAGGGAFQTIAPATERLKCDLVLALALAHHVCIRWQFQPSAFARGLAAFTRDAAIVEFVPSDDWHVAQWALPTPPGYSADGMHDALARIFDRVERLESEPAPRCLFVCEGKR
jgi:hypothetical protein